MLPRLERDGLLPSSISCLVADKVRSATRSSPIPSRKSCSHRRAHRPRRPIISSCPELQEKIVSIILENRRGNDFTKAQLDEIRDYAKRLAASLGNVAKDIKHRFGGRDEDGNPLKELFLKNKLTKGRFGGSYGDLTFENTITKRRLHIETVDIDPRTGEMTKRETERDARLRQNVREGDIIINIPKSKDGSTPDLDSYSDAIKNAFEEISRMP